MHDETNCANKAQRKSGGLFYVPDAIVPDAPGVKRTKSNSRVDNYTGTAEALVAAGLATLDMFPGQPGRPISRVSYCPTGEQSADTYRCFVPGYITIFRNALGTFRVERTVSVDEQARRSAAESEKRAIFLAEVAEKRRQEQERLKIGDRAQQLARAKRNLENMPASADDFRRRVVCQMRDWVRISLDIASNEASCHGYQIDPEPVMMSFDAIVEAVQTAEVKFDAHRHRDIEQRYRAEIAAFDDVFQQRLQVLGRPNPALLGGERQ